MDSLIQTGVLLVDPDRSIRVVLAAVLQRRGLGMTICTDNGAAAAQYLRHRRYTLVVISSETPGFASLLQQINASAARERPKVIVALDAGAEIVSTGADVVLAKPLHLDELDAAIAACTAVYGDDRRRSAEL